MPPNANPALDESFKGIERFYPTRIIEKGRSDGLDIGQKLDASYMVSSSYGDIKRHLSSIIRKDLQLDDIQDIKDFIINEVLP